MKPSKDRSPWIRAAICVVILSILAGCATTAEGAGGGAYTQNTDEAYRALGITRGVIEPWEDGMRTTGAPGDYEWWYFDFRLDDGSTLVVVFYTKAEMSGIGLRPSVSLDLDRPDGSRVSRSVRVGAGEFEASRERCDVRVGPNRVSGDLHTYDLHVDIEDVRADLRLTGTVPAWRPQTGVSVFGGGKGHYFAWLPSVPRGDVSGTITVGEETIPAHGSGYHDHNWGDTFLPTLIHQWYWGRAQVGEYSLIASWITAADSYGGNSIPVFMLARGGRILAEDGSKVRFSAEDVRVNEATGKPVADRIVYEYDDGADKYRVTFSRRSDLMEARFIDGVRGWKRFIALVSGFDGAYLRFTGAVTVERLEGEAVVEAVTEDAAVWELMYFGKAPEPDTR